jgi:hypothetical protein
LNATAVTMPAFFAASYMRPASSAVGARGFSQMMCLPASAAAIAISACRLLGVAMSITSIDGSLTTSRHEDEKPSHE